MAFLYNSCIIFPVCIAPSSLLQYDVFISSNPNFDDMSSDFSEFGENDDITFIDPDFGSVLSSDDSLDGHNIDYDASVILGTKGDDYIFYAKAFSVGYNFFFINFLTYI